MTTEAPFDVAFADIYQELRALAGVLLRGERRAHTLRATDLVHEVYLRIGRLRRLDGRDRARLMCLASRAMRNVLVDHAKRRGTDKRGGDRTRVPLSDITSVFEETGGSLLALDGALRRLESYDPRACKIIELRFFGGLTDEETAQLLGFSTRTVERSWRFARAWLQRELTCEG